MRPNLFRVLAPIAAALCLAVALRCDPAALDQAGRPPAAETQDAGAADQEVERLQPVLDADGDGGVGLGEIWNLRFLPGQATTVGNVLTAILLLVVGFVFARRVAHVVRRAVLPRVRVSAGAAAAVESLLFYLLLLIAFYSALSVAGVPLTAFALLGGAAAIGIGFGSQTVVADFIAGLILLLERPLREGDLIQVDDLYGNVVRVGARSTRVRTGDNVEIFVPNSLFIVGKIFNLTLTDSRMRTTVRVKVARGSPTHEVAALIKQAAVEHERVHDSPEPIVLFTDFGDDAFLFEVHFWIDVRTVMSRRLTESDLRFRIDELFREAGVTVAFPQRDVHLDTREPLEVRLVGVAERDGALP